MTPVLLRRPSQLGLFPACCSSLVQRSPSCQGCFCSDLGVLRVRLIAAVNLNELI